MWHVTYLTCAYVDFRRWTLQENSLNWLEICYLKCSFKWKQLPVKNTIIMLLSCVWLTAYTNWINNESVKSSPFSFYEYVWYDKLGAFSTSSYLVFYPKIFKYSHRPLLSLYLNGYFQGFSRFLHKIIRFVVSFLISLSKWFSGIRRFCHCLKKIWKAFRTFSRTRIFTRHQRSRTRIWSEIFKILISSIQKPIPYISFKYQSLLKVRNLELFQDEQPEYLLELAHGYVKKGQQPK